MIIDEEQIWFDEPFDKLPSKQEFKRWLKNVKKILEKTFVFKDK